MENWWISLGGMKCLDPQKLVSANGYTGTSSAEFLFSLSKKLDSGINVGPQQRQKPANATKEDPRLPTPSDL